jgi:CarD family transcriptional regulator
MFKIKDYVVYKKDVCQIIDIFKSKFNNEEYYKLSPIDDKSLTINIPTDNSSDNLKEIISKKDALALIKKIPSIEIIDGVPDKMLEQEYKRLISTGNHEDLIKIIKTTYLRNQARINDKKKIGEKDSNYFNLAESKLYNEFSIALQMSYEDTKKYIANAVNLNK